MYGYNQMLDDISRLTGSRLQSEVQVLCIGKSVMGRQLLVIKIGPDAPGKKSIFINGAHHGLEYITSLFLMQAAFCLAKSECILTKQATIYMMPMVNPDGVEIAQNAISPKDPFYEKLHRINGGGDFCTLWQANANGVDLNHNYDAAWELCHNYAIGAPAPTRYAGPFPESEPETRAVADFTRQKQFDMALAFHSQGEEIYWGFGKNEPARDKIIGERLARVTGYTLAKPTGVASFGGYKDWFVDKFHKPGYTIEVGKGKNPLPQRQIRKIYPQNMNLIYEAISCLTDSAL